MRPVKFFFNVPVIPFRVMVMAGYDDGEAVRMGSRFLQVDIVGVGESRAWEASNGKKGVIAFIWPPTHSVIAHECLHLTNDLLAYHGIQASTKGSLGELSALVSDFLVGKVTDGLQKRKFKIKALKR